MTLFGPKRSSKPFVTLYLSQGKFLQNQLIEGVLTLHCIGQPPHPGRRPCHLTPALQPVPHSRRLEPQLLLLHLVLHKFVILLWMRILMGRMQSELGRDMAACTTAAKLDRKDGKRPSVDDNELTMACLARREGQLILMSPTDRQSGQYWNRSCFC